MENLSPSEEDGAMHRCITERGVVLTLRGALFIGGRSELDPTNTILQRLVTILRGFPDSDIAVEGHTDALGSDGYNYGLSQRRADSVKLFLIAQGVIIPRITALGRGSSCPVATNGTAAGRRKNSRIEVIVSAALARAVAAQ